MPHSHAPDSFPSLLALFRKSRDMTKTSLAKHIGVTPGYVYLLETGRTAPPTLERVHQIVDTLGLDEDESERLIVAAAAGRTGAAEAKVLRETGPQRIVIEPLDTVDTNDSNDTNEGSNVARASAVVGDRISLRECVAIPITSDAMEPILTRGQLAICACNRVAATGDVVAVTLMDGTIRFGQHYPSDTGLLLTTTRRTGEPAELQREDVREVRPVIGVLFENLDE